MNYLTSQTFEKIKNSKGEEGFWISVDYGKYILRLENENNSLKQQLELQITQITYFKTKIDLLQNMNDEIEKQLKKDQSLLTVNRILNVSNLTGWTIALSCITGIVVFAVLNNYYKK